MAKSVMARAAVAVVVAAAAASAVHKNVRWKRWWKRFDGFVAIKKKRTSETTIMGVRHGPHYHRLSQSEARMTVHGGDRRHDLLQAAARCNNMMKTGCWDVCHRSVISESRRADRRVDERDILFCVRCIHIQRMCCYTGWRPVGEEERKMAGERGEKAPYTPTASQGARTLLIQLA